jgi:hypothetical protein
LVEEIIVEACASICLKTSKQSNIYRGHGGQNSNIEKDARYSEFDNNAAGFMAKKTADSSDEQLETYPQYRQR